MKVTRHKPSRCPSCDHLIDAATVAALDDEEASPRQGDFSICWNCGAVLRYRRDLTVTTCAPWDLSDLAPTRRLVLLDLAQRIRERLNTH